MEFCGVVQSWKICFICESIYFELKYQKCMATYLCLCCPSFEIGNLKVVCLAYDICVYSWVW